MVLFEALNCYERVSMLIVLTAKKQARELVETAAGKLKKKRGIKVSTKVIEGNSARAVLGDAERSDADLTGLGSHGNSAWERLPSVPGRIR